MEKPKDEQMPHYMEWAQTSMGNTITKKMENQEPKATTVLGTERKQKVSVSYTLKAFGMNVKKLEDAGWLTKEEAEGIKKIHKKIVEKWMKSEMGL